MRFQRRLKRSTRQYIVVALICIIVIGGAATITSILITGQIREEYQVLLKEAHDEMEANRRNVYIASEDIPAGEVIKKDLLEKKTVYSSQPQESYINENMIGKTTLVSISAGTQILNSMVTDKIVSAKLRETQFQVINMNSNITKYDTVDVRIFYPNGESYVVLAKKEIKAYIPETASVFLWLEEDEQLRMSAAIVDASLYSGSKLYVTKYIEPNIQEASIITYTPSISILSLIEDDPNIVERCTQKLNKDIRKALENRLSDSLTTDVAAIQWDVDENAAFAANTAQTYGDSQMQQKQNNQQEQQVQQEQKENATNEKVVSKAVADEPGVGKNAVTRKEAEKLSPDPTLVPPTDTDVKTWTDDSELGSASYFYYADNSSQNNEDIEFGE